MNIDSNLAAALLGAIVGAILGGAVSFAGAAFIERRKVVRETRIQMYREFLPELMRLAPSFAVEEPDEFLGLSEELHRASILAGSKDYRLAHDIESFATELLDFVKSHSKIRAAGKSIVNDPDRFDEMTTEMYEKLSDFSLYLERKLRLWAQVTGRR